MTLLAMDLSIDQQPPINRFNVSSLGVHKEWNFDAKIKAKGWVFIEKSLLILWLKKNKKNTRYTVLCSSKKLLSFSNHIKPRISDQFRWFQWWLAQMIYRCSHCCNGILDWFETDWMAALRRSGQTPWSVAKRSVSGCWKKVVDFTYLLRCWYLWELLSARIFLIEFPMSFRMLLIKRFRPHFPWHQGRATDHFAQRQWRRPDFWSRHSISSKSHQSTIEMFCRLEYITSEIMMQKIRQKVEYWPRNDSSSSDWKK